MPSGSAICNIISFRLRLEPEAGRGRTRRSGGRSNGRCPARPKTGSRRARPLHDSDRPVRDKALAGLEAEGLCVPAIRVHDRDERAASPACACSGGSPVRFSPGGAAWVGGAAWPAAPFAARVDGERSQPSLILRNDSQAAFRRATAQLPCRTPRIPGATPLTSTSSQFFTTSAASSFAAEVTTASRSSLHGRDPDQHVIDDRGRRGRTARSAALGSASVAILKRGDR